MDRRDVEPDYRMLGADARLHELLRDADACLIESLKFGKEELAFQQEVRDWLKENLTPEIVYRALAAKPCHTIGSLRRLSAHTASVIAALEPVYGIALAIVLLGRPRLGAHATSRTQST